MDSGLDVSVNAHKGGRSRASLQGAPPSQRNSRDSGRASHAGRAAASVGNLPAGIRESVLPATGVYDARRLRSQREVIRDVMLAAAICDTWLTLGELRALTKYGEASISAQLRHLRKIENGGYEVVKRHREGAIGAQPGVDGRGECVWEYRVAAVAPGCSPVSG